jgi:PAS domain S-box-containing protein
MADENSNRSSGGFYIAKREAGIPELKNEDLDRLQMGDNLFCSGDKAGIRFGLTVVQTLPGHRKLVFARADSNILMTISRAARIALYLAAVILLLIVPVVMILPRQILKPFKKMRETAQSAGRMIPTHASDEVADIIHSYESIIEELKRNEIELERLYRESAGKADRLERLNRYILKSIGSGVINVDLSGKVIGCNRAASEILGCEREMVLGAHYLVAFPQEMELALLIGAGLERGDVVSRREIELNRPGDRNQWLGVESSVILNDNGRIVGVTLLITDLTELKRLQNDLEMNRRMAALGEMTAGLAHQLRNSLAAVSGFCQLLQKKTGPDSEIGDIAGSIRTETAASEEMVSRFLTFAKPLSLNETLFDFGQLVRECVVKFTPESEANGTTLRMKQPPERLEIIGDALLLKEAICNLIDNAVEAAGEGGEVDIYLESLDRRLSVIIADDGPGIPGKIKNTLFTPFVSAKPSGTGLGLALSRKIINLHHGTITLESGQPRGTVCRVTLPGKTEQETTPEIFLSETAKKQ